MTATELIHLRLASQQIAASSCSTPLEVVTTLGALQAQDYAGALWSVGLRLPGATVADVEQALQEGSIVRTWPMRGTLHLVPAVDARWMLRLMAPRVLSGAAARERNLGLSKAVFAKSFDVFRSALAGGKQLERQEMMTVLQENGVATEGQRGYHILWRAAQEALICLGPMHGKQQSFVLFDSWVSEHRELTREESIVKLARRFYTSHGPATSKDFMRWTKLTSKDANYALQNLRNELKSVEVNGYTYWYKAGQSPIQAEQAYLLPGFDEYMLGYGDRSLIVEDDHHRLVVPGSNGMFMPTIIINGRVSGIWKRTIKRKEVVITLKPFIPLKKAELGLIAEAANRYGMFIGLPARIDNGA